jgi:hypothetical protein
MLPLKRYFLLQATLIPIHCLRRNPTHGDAASWRVQVLTALDIINAMTELNPSATKCRDIIHRLCGESLMPRSHQQSQSRPQSQSQPRQTQSQSYPMHGDPGQQDSSAAALPWAEYLDGASNFANPLSFPFPPSESTDGAGNPWMTEVDTAINGYDVYCDRLSNAVVAGQHHDNFGQGSGSANEGADGGPAAGAPGLFSVDGTELGTGVQDWDLGLMLSIG